MLVSLFSRFRMALTSKSSNLSGAVHRAAPIFLFNQFIKVSNLSPQGRGVIHI